ncbi:MAG: ABC transporter substrate-binding protein [Polyangiales bacterium]
MTAAEATNSRVEELWFTRCPVPTATGLAYKLGWLEQAFAPDGITLRTLQDADPALGRHHYDHALPTLIREGGSMLAIGARAQGADTRLIGLTWIDEWQTILVRPDSNIRGPADLAGKRLALPAWTEHAIPSHQRGCSIARGMSLHGYKGALQAAGLGFDDVSFVEVPGQRGGTGRRGVGNLWAGIDLLRDGRVDAVYVKGASAVEAARQAELVVGIDLDQVVERRQRVNNGTPRPITVHAHLLANHFELVVRFLHQTLRAAEWARHDLEGVRAILRDETSAHAGGVERAYRGDFHQTLHPTLDRERIELFRAQKSFLLTHGFLDADFDLDAWIDPRPLAVAHERLC